VPSDELASVRIQDLLGASDEPDIVVGCGRGRLVAADVEVVTGRELRNLANDVVEEPVGDLFVDTQRAGSTVWGGGATPVQLSSGYEAKAAFECPGTSISGTTVMKCPAA
jgi:hypothetical protein